MPAKRNNAAASIKTPEELEAIYLEFESRLLALKKEKDAAVSRVLRKIDDEKIRRILSKIK
ncbi:MAG: hypothetical protein WCT26_00320 [Candidatus Buchananbacteria bacterium]|jgi:hypothetical protein